MPARKHINPNQLSLFMTGDEIKSLVSDSVDRLPARTEWDEDTEQEIEIPAETMDEMWAGKTSKKHQEMALTEGIRRHVTIQTNPDGTYTMGQGHHRVQASSDLAKQGRTIYVPVIYDEDWDYSGNDWGEYGGQYPDAPNERF